MIWPLLTFVASFFSASLECLASDLRKKRKRKIYFFSFLWLHQTCVCVCAHVCPGRGEVRGVCLGHSIPTASLPMTTPSSTSDWLPLPYPVLRTSHFLLEVFPDSPVSVRCSSSVFLRLSVLLQQPCCSYCVLFTTESFWEDNDHGCLVHYCISKSSQDAWHIVF